MGSTHESGSVMAFQPLVTRYLRNYCLFAKAASSAMQVRTQYPTSGTNHFEKWNTIINLHQKSWKVNISGWIFDLAPLGLNHTVRFTSDFSILWVKAQTYCGGSGLSMVPVHTACKITLTIIKCNCPTGVFLGRLVKTELTLMTPRLIAIYQKSPVRFLQQNSEPN